MGLLSTREIEAEMQFYYTSEQTDLEVSFGGFRHINALGKIAKGDADKLLNLILKVKTPPQTTIYINSTGGDLEEGIKLGCVIRAYGLETSIGTYVLEPGDPDEPIVSRKHKVGSCLSAATMMFAGGRLRHFPQGSKFGVHRFAFENPVSSSLEKSQELSAGMASFLADMGVSLSFLQVSASTPSEELHFLEHEELRKHRMVTDGETDVVWGIEMRSNLIYVRGTRDSIFGKHKVMLAHAKDVGFMFFAVIEAQGRQEELCNLGLVEIVANGEEHRIDISNRCERVANNIDVIVTSNVTKDEAAIIAYSKSFGIQIRFSSKSDMFLGVSAMDTTGGQDSLITLYNSMI